MPSDNPFPAALPAGAERVRDALRARQADVAAAGVRLLDDSARTAEQAAAALGVGVAQIVKSMVFAADGVAVLVLTAGDHRVDPAKVAALLGAGRVERADPGLVRSATGYAIGGVPPVGHERPVRTVVDVSLLRFELVWCAAGTPHAVFPVAPAALIASIPAVETRDIS